MRISKITGWLTFVLLVSGSLFTHAQDSTLSLNEAIQFALQHNRQLAQTRLDEDLGKYQTREVRAQALPQISANGQFTDNLKKSVFVLPDLTGAGGPSSTVEVGTQYNLAFNLQLSQKIFDKAVFTGLKAARAGEDFYDLSTKVGEDNLIYSVAGMFYQIQVSKEQLVVLNATVNQIEQLKKATQTQYDNGLVKKNDLDRIKVNLTNYRTQYSRLQNQVSMQENQFKLLLGLSADRGINLPEAKTDKLKVSIAAISHPDSLNLDSHNQYLLLEKQKQLLKYDKKAKIAAYYPSLSAFANYSYNGISDQFDFLKSAGSDYWYGTAAVGLTLNIPIFSGMARKARVDQAEVSLLKIDQQLEQTAMALNTAYDNAQLQIKNSLETISTQQQNVNLAKEVYASTQNNYQLGLASLTDLLNAEVALVEAQNSYNQALLEYKIAELEVLKSNGNLNTLINERN